MASETGTKAPTVNVNDMFAKWAKTSVAKNSGKYVIMVRPNLGALANTVRANGMSDIKGAPLFNSIADAEAWIKNDGDKKMVYQIYDAETKKVMHAKWVFGVSWHTTSYEQDQNRGYKSDKNPKMRMNMNKPKPKGDK